MPISHEKLSAHPLWDDMASLKELIGETSKVASPQVLEALVTWREAITYAERIREVPAWRFPNTQTLDQMSQAVRSAMSATQEVPNESFNSQVYSYLISYLDGFTSALNNTPSNNVTSGHLKGITENVQMFQENIRTAIEDARASADSAVTQANEVVEALKAKASSIEEKLAKQSERLDARIDSNASDFADWTQAQDESVSEICKRIESAGEAAMRDQKIRAEASLARLVKMVKEAETLSHVMAKNTISTDYAGYARKQGAAATAWSVCAVIFTFIALKFLLDTVRDVHALSLGESVFKATVSTAVLGTAAFMGREASGHRRESRDAKRTQLDLNTLEPYIANMDEDEAAELRRELAHRIFNRPLANHHSGRFYGWGQRAGHSAEKSEEEADSP